MTTPVKDVQVNETIESKLSELLIELVGEHGTKTLDTFDTHCLQQLVSLLIKVYVSKVKAGETTSPVSKSVLTETETVVFVDALLQYMEIELFEIQMWRSLGSNY